ncbi:hypothetical protein FOZ60_003371 [Perkinsus olseni]|uniref:RING-type domain-containing protein n=1 Tax=Perkinsus olseni TaxID=32597 RepID=A0A7J6PI11_PEROL|nr:hypothetical protein FOZ60_003371 [Perkinsus olseni]
MSTNRHARNLCCTKVLHFVEPSFSRKRYLISWGVYMLLIVTFVLMCVLWPAEPGIASMVRAGVLICYGCVVTILPPVLIVVIAYVVEQSHSAEKKREKYEKTFLKEWSSWVSSETKTETLADADIQDCMEEGDNSGCVICLNDFQVGDNVRVLPCGHKFHTECFDACFNRVPCSPSLEYHQCPLCRVRMGPSLPKRHDNGGDAVADGDVAVNRAHSVSEASTAVSV